MKSSQHLKTVFYLKPTIKVKPIFIATALVFNPFVLNQLALAEDNATDSTEQAIELNEIKVTGTKRSQELQDVMQSVTVFEPKDTIGMENSLDVLKRVPNMTMQTGNILPTVRGLDGNGVAFGGNGAVSGARPRMSNIIDGVSRSYSATPDGLSSFWDINQVEVYRGAQSTQLGRNAIAGALVQTTNDPKFKDEYSAMVGVRDEKTTYNAAFMLNKKINDQFAIRLTGEGLDGDNFVDYSDLGDPNLSKNDKDDAGELKFSRFRFKALLAPTAVPDLVLKLTVDSERNAANNRIDAVEQAGRGRKLVNFAGGYSFLETFNTVSSLNGVYAINDEWLFDGIVAHQRVKSSFLPPPDSNPNPSDYLNFTFDVRETSYEPKLKYTSKNTRSNAVIGAFYLTRDRDDFGKPGTAFDLDAKDKSSTKSLFADATIQVNDQWDVLLGARLEKEQQKRKFTGLGGFFNFDFDATANVFLPKLGATYHITPEASLSAMAYQGYTAGGGGVRFDLTALPYLFDKEKSTTYELVARAQFFDKKLTTNANFFYTQLKDSQQYAVGPLSATDFIIDNAKKARTSGAEFEVNYQVSAKTSAFASVGLLDTKIIKFGGNPVNDESNGNEFAFSPSVTARIGGSVEVYPNLIVGGDVNYTSERFSDYQNTQENKLDAMYISNLNMRYQFKKATFTGFINNVFNEYAFLSKESSGLGTVNPPRTVGLNVKLDF